MKIDDINPGTGYRLLEVGEIIQPGDDYWSRHFQSWVSTCDGDGETRQPPPKTDVYRRRKLNAE